MDCLLGQKKWPLQRGGCCGEVAFSEGSTVVLRGTNSAQFKNIAWPNDCTKGILNSCDRKNH